MYWNMVDPNFIFSIHVRRGATRPRHPRQILGARGLRGPGRGPRRKEEKKEKKEKVKKKEKKGKKKKRGREKK